MSNRLADTSAEYKQIDALLRKDMPLYRKAYSDRTAWLMACFAELAYIKFSQPSKKETLLAEIGTLKCELAETFDNNGTQAILVSNEKYLVLAFRGTEADSFADIKADLKAKTTPLKNDGKIHSGFNDAYNEVDSTIQQSLSQEKFKNKPLFITGHSLGGALATIAAKVLSHEGGIAACYTFGSPRVGSAMWTSTIKSPIYRVVNAADGVTMVPFGGATIGILRGIFGIVPYIGGLIRSRLANYADYAHAGDMRYLTNCPKGKYTGVKLLYSTNLLYRVKGLYRAQKSAVGLFKDHSISTYRKKLMIIAEQRNQK